LHLSKGNCEYEARMGPCSVEEGAIKFLPSKFEIALRACNRAAKTSSPTTVQTTWRLVQFTEAASTVPQAFATIGALSDVPYCSEWDTASDKAKEFSTLAGTAPGCAEFKTKLSAFSSNWDGVKYSDDTPSDPNSNAKFTETSKVIDVSF
jgi:hypothetical protein